MVQMEEKIKEPISELYKRLAEVKRRPLSSFVSLENARMLSLGKESDVNE